jgi:pyruvate/2-oxoglutarate dehydrogenase complex dihydrolipoamide dehydrogenase (E3) component
MVGPNAGDLISEAVLALEMGADAGDISLYRARSRMRKMETQETPII